MKGSEIIKSTSPSKAISECRCYMQFPSLPFNFCGIKQDFKKAKVAILPVPYDSTTFYKTGSREGPLAIIRASRSMELYDLELDCQISDIGIYTLDELEPQMTSAEKNCQRVFETVSKIIKQNKFLITLGGEHSISIGATLAFSQNFSNLSVLHLDAHLDLRDTFEGTKFSHACVARRAREFCPVISVGIRSLSQEEKEYIKKKKIKNIFFGKNLNLNKIVSCLNKNVYLTIDLDVFDPSIMPAVGSPEPNGLFWEGVISILKAVALKRNIVGADVVELCPVPGLIFPNYLSAQLVYKIIGYKFFLKK